MKPPIPAPRSTGEPATDIWAGIARRAAEVRRWPAWKRNGTGLLSERTAMETKDPAKELLADEETRDYTVVCDVAPEEHLINVTHVCVNPRRQPAPDAP